MKSNLSQVFRIQKFLNQISYPDAYRSAREISNFLDTNNKLSENKILDKIKDGEPWEYICNYTTFCENTFKVTRDTLIPRIESEQIVYDTQKTLQNSDIKHIIDVGTGSGCLIISLAKTLKNPSYSFWATDISDRALKVAEYNEKNILNKEKIHWIKTDLIKDIPKLDGKVFIIANLPYISTEQYQKLDKSVKEYEPRNALDGGKNGLKYYRKLFTQIKRKQLAVKHLYIETEESIFKNTKELIHSCFPNSHIEEKQDCFNKKRFLFVTLPEQE
jgi:release factor glutamine methyltransferase